MVLEKMTQEEKWTAMESLWENLRSSMEESSDTPSTVCDMLDERRERVQSGKAQVMDWDIAKSTLRSRSSR